jgi:hypothetical protein
LPMGEWRSYGRRTSGNRRCHPGRPAAIDKLRESGQIEQRPTSCSFQVRLMKRPYSLSLRGREPRPASLCGRFEARQPETWWSGRRRLSRFCVGDRVLLSSAARNKFGRGAPGRLGDLPLGVFFVRRRNRAGRVAPEVDSPRAGFDRLQIAQGASVCFQCVCEHARPKLRVPGDNVVVDPDLERAHTVGESSSERAPRAAQWPRAFGTPTAYRKPRPIADAFQ